MYSPGLRQEPRHEPAAVIPVKQEASLLDWLESSGRLIARDNQEESLLDGGQEEIEGLMGSDDSSYDDLEDDDLGSDDVDDDE